MGEKAPIESFAVIGGEGFLGQALVQRLLALYPTSQVASLGLTQRTFTPSSYRFYSTDLTSPTSILESLKISGATTVFHTASPHPTASEAVCQAVNVGGTQRVVEACVALGVRKLVFTSSMTVCFEGVSMSNVDERLPTTNKLDDCYVATKVAAEKIVLEANGKGGLSTCSLRLAGVIGPGDRQVIPGLIKVLKAHQTCFQLGQNKNLFDFVHVDNAVHAHLLAASLLTSPTISADMFESRLSPVNSSNPRRMLPTSIYTEVADRPSSILDTPLPASRNRFDQFHHLASSSNPEATSIPAVAGQSFFITNGEPIPFWTFARSVWYHYNGHVPSFVIPIPTELAMALAGFAEAFAWCRGIKKSEAGLNKVHVKYVVSDLYCNIEKARRVLGYEPIISLDAGIKDAVEAYKVEAQRVIAARK